MNIAKLGWLLCGLVCLGLGYGGVFVPGLPTTVFILLALYAFTRSSRRLENWVRRQPLLRSAVAQADEYRDRKVISRRVKVVAQGFAWSSAGLVFLTTGFGWGLGLTVLAALSCSLFMARSKTK